MEHNETITIFHLYRQDGTALFLHPFDNLDKLIQHLKRADIVGKYGTEPRVESLTLFRNDLYRMIEAAVKSWVTEKRFIPRFLISAGVFLVSYLFLSFVVRDPLPIIDEILIGVGVAFVSYFLLSRRDQRSSLALRKRAELRTSVDRIVFSEGRFIKQFEQALQERDAESREEIIEELLNLNSEKSFEIEDQDEAKQLIDYLDKKFNTRDYRKHEKMLSKAKVKESDSKKVELLSRWTESKKIDLSLFAVYRRMKRSYRGVK